MDKKLLGQKGEELATDYLTKRGFKIIERNRHFSRFCEADIIAEDKGVLVFVEVKTRRNNSLGSPLEAITKTKYQHLKTGLFTYLQENPKYKKFRIDAIAITLEPFKIEHLKNINV